jgi:hypothetical protein
MPTSPPPTPIDDEDDADPRRTALRRELVYFGIAAGIGIVLLPFAVYFAGALTLGPYEGGLLRFLGKLYGDFIRFTPAAIALLLGPYALFQAVRLLTRPFRYRTRAAKAQN